VVAIDDHQLILDALRLTLENAEGIEFVGQASSDSWRDYGLI